VKLGEGGAKEGGRAISGSGYECGPSSEEGERGRGGRGEWERVKDEEGKEGE